MIPVAALVVPVVVMAPTGIPKMASSSPHNRLRNSSSIIVLPGKGRVPGVFMFGMPGASSGF